MVTWRGLGGAPRKTLDLKGVWPIIALAFWSFVRAGVRAMLVISFEFVYFFSSIWFRYYFYPTVGSCIYRGGSWARITRTTRKIVEKKSLEVSFLSISRILSCQSLKTNYKEYCTDLFLPLTATNLFCCLQKETKG